MNENNVDIGIAATTLKPTPEEITVSVPENVTAIVMNEVGEPTVALTGSTNVAVDTEDNVTTTVAEALTVSNSVINVETPIPKPPPRVVNTAHLMTHIVNPDLSDDSVFSGEEDSCDGEPAEKRMKLEQDINIDMDQSLKQILFNINKAICLRLDSIENKLDNVGLRTKYLEVKLLELVNQNKNGNNNNPTSYATKRGSTSPSRRSGALIVGLPQDRNSDEENQFQKGIDSDLLQSMQLENKDKKGKLLTPSDFNNSNVDSNFRNIGPNVTLITLNSEEDYPNGCWLGDELNLEMRVRVPISSSDLLHIHSNCRTAEKMALTLLDYLFDRETQACSNLSGMGKHGKKQLDPLMIYGIWCHLIQRFKINESDWQRIKQNIDSKCRTAFRRKLRGLPLAVKAFRGRAPPSYVHNAGFNFNSVMNSQSNFYDSNLHEDTKFHIQQQSELDIQQAVTMQGEALQQGEIQILHATPEQISQLQHAQHIQILQGDQVIQQLQSAENQENVQVVSMGTPDRVHVATVTTENGEIVHIHQARPLANVGASTATTAATPTITAATTTTDGNQTNV